MWLRNLFRKWLGRRQSPIQTRNKIAARRKARPALEILEDRLAPAALVGYTSNSGELDFTATASETITVAPGSLSNQIQIHVSDTITLGGDASSNSNFVLSAGDSTLTISNVNSGVTINNFNLTLANQTSNADSLTFGLGATSGIQNVNIAGPTGQTDSVDTVLFSSTTISGSMDVTVGAIGSVASLPAETVNVAASSAVLNAGGTSSPIGPLTTNLAELTATTDDGGISITNLGSGPLTVDSITADQGGQGPTVSNDQVVYNSTPNSTPTYIAGSSNVAITSAGPVILNAISATGSLTVVGPYIVEGGGASQAIDAQTVDLDATGAVNGPVQATVTFTPNLAGDAMTLGSGTWAGLGFVAGGLITVTGDANPSNDGTFTIASVAGSTLTLTVSEVLTSETSASVALGLPLEVTFSGATMTLPGAGPTWSTLGVGSSGTITVVGAADPANDGTFTITGNSTDTLTLSASFTSETAAVSAGTGAVGNYQGQVTFANSASGDTLTLPSTGPTWTALGFSTGSLMAGDSIVVSGATQSVNNAAFTIASVSLYTLTLQQSYVLYPETESEVTVANGMIGLTSSPGNTSAASTAIDLVETNGFTATTANGNIFLSLGSSVDSTATDVVAGGTGNVSVISSAKSLTIENITAQGETVTGDGSAIVGGIAVVEATQGSLLETGSPGTITADIVSLSSAENLGSTSSLFLTDAASGLTVDETATSSASASAYVENTGTLASVGVSTDDGTVEIYQNGTITPLLSFANNQLSESASTALVSFANTDTTGGAADNVTIKGTINADNITAGGQILAKNSSTLIEDTVMPGLILSAGNGIGNPTNTIDTEVSALNATTKTGGIFTSNTPLPGSGAMVEFTTSSNGAIAAVTSVTGGTGYPDDAMFDLLVTGGGGVGAIIQVVTNSVGAFTSWATSPVVGGIGYTATGSTAVSTSAVLLLTAASANGNINVANSGYIYLYNETTSGAKTTAISTGSNTSTATVTLAATEAIYSSNSVSVAAGTLVLTASAVGTASDPLLTSISNLTVNNAVAGGLFLSNSTALTASSASTSGVVSISATGDLALDGNVTGTNVTLTSTGGSLTSTSTVVITASGTLTLTAQQIGDSSTYSPDGVADEATEVLQTNATTIDAQANYGGIYLSNNNSGTLNLTAGAVGPQSGGSATSNIEIDSEGSIKITPQSTTLTTLSGSQPVGIYNPSGTATLFAGETLSYSGTASSPTTATITSAGSSGTYYDVDAGTLTIDGSAPIATSASATGAGYTSLVVETNTPSVPVTGSQTSTVPLELTASELSEGGIFTAASIIIDNLGASVTTGVPNGTPGVLTIAAPLTLDATAGTIVFLNPNDTIVVTGSGNTITVLAGTTISSNGTITSTGAPATSNDVVVLGNLQTTGGGNINISAVGNVSIGTVNAGTGHVYLTSITGSILSSNGTALEITGATVVKSSPQSGASQSAPLVQLNATEAIAAATQAEAAYAAAVAQAGADQSTATALQAALSSNATEIVNAKATYESDVQTYNQDNTTDTNQQTLVNNLGLAIVIIDEAAAVAGVAGSILELVADAIPAPFNTPVGIVGAAFEVAGSALGLVGATLSIVAYAEGLTLNNDNSAVEGDGDNEAQAYAQWQADLDTQTAVTAAYNSVEQAYTNEEVIVKADAVIVTAAQIASAQATAALVGTAGPLPLTVAGPVTISDQGSGVSSTNIVVNTPITVSEPGSGAQVSITEVSGAITAVSPTPASGGTGYPASSTFDLAVAGGSGGVVQATTNASGVIISFAPAPIAGGTGYSNNSAANTVPTAAVATTGSGAQVAFTAAGGVLTSVDSNPVAGGMGYPHGSTFDLMVTGGGGSGAVVQAMTNSSGVVTSFSLISGGSGYTTTGATSGSTGSGAEVSFIAAGGIITSVDSTPVAGGTGYPDNSTFNLVVTGGSGGVVQAMTNGSGVITSFSLIAGGIGYNSTAATGLAGVSIYANSPLTVSANISAPGAIILTADSVDITAGTTIDPAASITITGDANDDGYANVTVAGTLDAQSALVTMDAGSPGYDTFNITPSATTPITVTGVGPDNTLNINALGRTVTISETPTGDTITVAGMQPVMISNIAFANIVNGAGVNFASIAQGTAAFSLNSVPLTVSGAWVNQVGSFTISGSTDTAQSSTSLSTINGISNANEAVDLTINTLTSGEQVGLVARYSGTGLANMYYGAIAATSASTYTAYIDLYVNGALTTLFSQNFTGTVTHETLEFDVVGDSLQLFLNGSLVAYANDSTFTTDGVGMLTTGGAVVVSNFNAAPITQQTAANNAYSDPFNSQGSSVITSIVNGQLDDYWVNQVGDFSTGGTGTATALTTIALATVNGTSTATNEAVDLTINTLSTGEQVGLVARYSGSGLGNMYYGSIMATSTSTYTASISLYVNGARTTLFSQNYTGTTTGKTLEFDVAGDSFQLFLNGSLVAYATDGTFAAGSVGMLSLGGAVVVSNFNAAPITQQTVSNSAFSNSFSDSFNSQGSSAISSIANSQLDDYWVDQVGDFTTGGAGTATGSAPMALATVNGIVTATNEAISLTIDTLSTGEQVGLVARYSGSGLANMYYGAIMATSANTYTASISLYVNGSRTVLFSQSYTGTATAQTLQFDVVGSSLQLTLNDSIVAYANDTTFAAGGVGMLTSGGAVVISNFNAAPITPQTAANDTSYSDNFSTANNGQLDEYWVNQDGAFTAGGTGTATSVGSENLSTVNGITNANEAVSLTIGSLPTGDQVGLVARYNGSGPANMYYGAIVAASTGTYTAYISLNVNGTWTPLFSQNYTGTPGGETLDFDVVGSSLQLSLNGSLVAYANDSTFATGSVGMLTWGGAVAVSNFNAMPITQQTASSNAYCDHFTTANNGQLDEYWINQDGAFTTAGTGTAAAVSSVSLATVNGITHANEAVSLTISSLATGQQVGLVARYNGSGLANMYYGAIVATSADTYTAYISLNVNGTWAPLFSQNYTGTPGGETLDFDVVGSSLQLSLNGSLVAYANDSTFATGGVGMLTWGGPVAVSNFKATPITQQTASSNAYSDSFTAANNGQLDEYWVNQYGAFTSGGTGTATAESSVSLATINGITNAANEAVSLTISSLATGQQVGLAARYDGSGLANMYIGSIVATSTTTYTAYIYHIVNGVGAPLNSETYQGSPSSLAGDTLEFDVVGSSLQLYLNGSIVAYANDSTITVGGVGMLASGGAVVVSSFNAAPITQQTVSGSSYSDHFSTQGQDAITGDNDGQLDNYWINQYGDFQVNTTDQTATAMTSIALATVNGISTPQTASNPFTDTFSTQGSYANEAVSLTISSLATGQQVGLVARYNGSGLANMYYGSIMATSANTYTAFIDRIVNGVGTPLISENYQGSPSTLESDTLEFDVDGSSLQLYLAGSLVAAANDSMFGTGGVGMLTSGGQVVVSAFNVSATVGASNGQLDNYWVNQYGAFTTAGTGTATAADAVSLATVNGITNANEAVSLTISSLATGQQVGLVARYDGPGLTGMYYGSIVATSSTTYTAYIYRIVDGVGASLFNETYQGSPGTLEGDTLEFEVVGSSLQLSLNDSLVAYANDSTFATGGVGMLTRGGAVAVSNFNAAPITQQTASSNAYSDNFTTANNGQLDEYWVNQYGAFTTAGTGTAAAVSSVSLATVNGITNANEAVSLTISSLATGQQVGLVARYNGSGLANMYYGLIANTSSTTYTAYIYRIVNGVGVPLYSETYQGSPSTLEGDTLEFDVVGSSLHLFLNGSLVAYANDSTFATGGVGMLTSGGAVAVSNFNAAPITQQTASNNSYSDSFSSQGSSVITSIANGQLDDYWVNQYGDFQVNTTNETATALGAASLATVNGINNANEAVSLTIDTLETGQQVGLVARYSGSGLANMYYGSITATSSNTYTASIYMNVAGILTPLFSETYSGSASAALNGKTLEFDVVGTSLQLFLNGTIVAYANNSTFATGGVGMLTSGGPVVVSNFNAVAITPPTASYPFAITAAGTSPITGLNNDQLNSYWSTQAGDYVDNAGTLTAQSSGVNLATVNGVSQTNANVSATITLTNGQYAGLVTRYAGSGVQNMYFGEIVAGSGTYTAYIYSIVDGVWTQLASQTHSGSVAGAVLEFAVSGTSPASLTLKLNGTTVATATDSTLTGAGSVGILSSGGATISSFSAD